MLAACTTPSKCAVVAMIVQGHTPGDVSAGSSVKSPPRERSSLLARRSRLPHSPARLPDLAPPPPLGLYEELNSSPRSPNGSAILIRTPPPERACRRRCIYILYIYIYPEKQGDHPPPPPRVAAHRLGWTRLEYVKLTDQYIVPL